MKHGDKILDIIWKVVALFPKYAFPAFKSNFGKLKLDTEEASMRAPSGVWRVLEALALSKLIFGALTNKTPALATSNLCRIVAVKHGQALQVSDG